MYHNQDLAYLFARRVASKDSGKPILDAAFGEVTVTCEKICWLLKEGERWLRPEYRSSSRMVQFFLLLLPRSAVGQQIGAEYPAF